MKVRLKENILPINLNSFRRLPLEFYLRDTVTVAKELIGKLFVKIDDDVTYSAIITETEAYLGKDDWASHSAVGYTRRNAAMFAMGGTLYVYQIYGIHYCANVVTEAAGIGAAVLLRALEPVSGISKMKLNRRTTRNEVLCDGPSKLCQAFHINKKDNHASMLTGNIFIAENDNISKFKILATQRIGISKSTDLPLRFLMKKI